MQEENTFQPEEHQAEQNFAGETAGITEPGKEKAGKRVPDLLKLSLALNAILMIGVVILYILHFTAKKEETTSAIPMATVQKVSGSALKVVFVNIDSLNAQYDFVKHLKSDLESTGKKLQNEILGEQAAFEKEANEFQKAVASNAIPEEKAKLQYEALMQKQQALAEKKDRYTQQVADKELDMNLRLLDTVTSFLKRYNRKYRFDYILGYKTAGEILVGNDTLDITRNVLGELNREYADRKK
jgi:outer membrane protein